MQDRTPIEHVDECGCIDLERAYGWRYRVAYEDPALVSTQDPWHKILECKHGHISPAGGAKLWACTSSNRSRITREIREGKLPCVIKQDADDGVSAEFDVKDAAVFFELMGAKTK